MKTLIQNARLISPDFDQPDSFLLLDQGVIVDFGAMNELTYNLNSEDIRVNLEGKMILPGFIDIHSHGADGRDVCDNQLSSLEHIAQKKIQEGVTTWLPTTLTQPPNLLKEIVSTCATFKQNERYTRCPGLHIEGPYINAAKAGAQNPEFVRPPDLLELQELHDICPAKIISMAPEIPGATELISGARELGIVCSAAHTEATSQQIFQARSAGLTHLTHFGNAMLGLHHREIGAVGAGLIDENLSLELITDTIHLAPEMIKLIAQLVPIERLLIITDSTAASWIGDGELQLGGLDVVVQNGVARLKEGGALAGSAVTYNEAFRHFVECSGLAYSQAVKATSWNQAQSLGLAGFGAIKRGFHADLVVLNADFSVHQTWIAGSVR